jgi:methyl halide transferase
MAIEDVRTRLLNHFANNSSDQPDRWAKLWDNGDFLPWDKGLPNPALVDVLSEKQDLIGTCLRDDAGNDKKKQQQRKKAFVPGCGRGYDVLLLASFGYDAYGLEVSEKAVQLCVQEQKANGHEYPVRDEAGGAGNAVFVEGDFFSDDWTDQIQGGATFDLIYDYTVGIFAHLYRGEAANLIDESAVPLCSSSVHASRVGIAPISAPGTCPTW